MHAIRTAESGQAEIRDDEPLRRGGSAADIVVVAGDRLPVGGLGDHDINAGFELADGFEHGEGRRYILVQRRFRIERA